MKTKTLIICKTKFSNDAAQRKEHSFIDTSLYHYETETISNSLQFDKTRFNENKYINNMKKGQNDFTIRDATCKIILYSRVNNKCAGK